MRYLVLPLVLILGCSTASRTQSPGTPRPVTAHAAKPADALSSLNHPVSTKNAEAQRHFNDGLTLIVAFNHDEAIRSFKKAAEADPNLGMAHWGIALALGPNYNVDVDAQREKEAATELQNIGENQGRGESHQRARDNPESDTSCAGGVFGRNGKSVGTSHRSLPRLGDKSSTAGDLL